MINNHLQGNLKAREIAMASGKFRNPAKIAFQQQQRDQAFKEARDATILGLSGPGIKNIVKEILLDEGSQQNHLPPK